MNFFFNKKQMGKKDDFHSASYFLILGGLCVILYYNINISSTMISVSQVVIYGIAVFSIIVGLWMGIINTAIGR